MNIADKAAALSECRRVLKPEGKLLWTQVVLDSGNPHFPLPWATQVEGSVLDTSEELQQLMEAAGFRILALDDDTRLIVELARKRQSGEQPPAEVHEANSVVLGPDFVERRKNFVRSLTEGRLASVCIELMVC